MQSGEGRHGSIPVSPSLGHTAQPSCLLLAAVLALRILTVRVAQSTTTSAGWQTASRTQRGGATFIKHRTEFPKNVDQDAPVIQPGSASKALPKPNRSRNGPTSFVHRCWMDFGPIWDGLSTQTILQNCVRGVRNQTMRIYTVDDVGTDFWSIWDQF